MSKSKVIILGSLVLLLTMCCNFGGLKDTLMDKAVEQLEEAELPEGAMETVQAMPEALAPDAVDAAEGLLEDAQDGDLDAMGDAIDQMLDEATSAMEGMDPSQVPYPMPADAQVYDFSGGAATFQTNMNVAGVVDFYRQTLGAQGYTERTINTVVDEQVASLVFDGDPSGIELVVQVTGLGDNMSIVNIRLEDI